MPVIRGVTVAFAMALLLAACSGDADRTPTPTATSTEGAPSSTLTSTPTRTPEPSGTASPSPTAAPLDTRSITGLFTDPRPVAIDNRRELPPEPVSPFASWNGSDVVVYDTVTMVETNLGAGFVGFGPAFSPNGARFAWTEGPPTNLSGIWVLDLDSGERRRIADGGVLRWLDDDTLYARQQMESNNNERLDIETGEWSPADDIDPNAFEAPAETAHWRLASTSLDELPPTAYPFWSRTFTLTDRTGTLVPLVFEAYEAALTDDGALFVATPPTEPVLPPDSGPHLEYGVSNVFEVDPLTGVASFIASAEASAPNWAFDASGRYVGWMDGFCGQSFADIDTVLYDRGTGELTALDRGMWFHFTPDDLIAQGAFDPRQLIDPQTLETVAILPEQVLDISWSADYRYAAVGFQFGHGGLCG